MPNMVWIGESASQIISCPANEISNARFPPKPTDPGDNKLNDKVTHFVSYLYMLVRIFSSYN